MRNYYKLTSEYVFKAVKAHKPASPQVREMFLAMITLYEC